MLGMEDYALRTSVPRGYPRGAANGQIPATKTAGAHLTSPAISYRSQYSHLFAEPIFEVTGKIVIGADYFKQHLQITVVGACLILNKDYKLYLSLELLICSEVPLARV